MVPHNYDLQLNVVFNPHPDTTTTNVTTPASLAADSLVQGLGPEFVLGWVNISLALGVSTQCLVLHAVGMRLGDVKYNWRGQEWAGGCFGYTGWRGRG